jgi:hypothetical protein
LNLSSLLELSDEKDRESIALIGLRENCAKELN